MKKTIEESVVTAMDGADSNLFPYLPYILQDLWEIGSSPEVIIELIRKHTNDYSSLKILDLGCGK
ncbi:MAG: class I SAM-dependent methyltransferase, partial [Acidobacteria bacterium]|nr:class I SAM-dependent methyltransferase [Acidobacteriota bacterium]